MNGDINVLIPEELKGYDYQKTNEKFSKDLQNVLDFLNKSNLGVDTFNLEKYIQTETMVKFLEKRNYEEIPSSDNGKKWNGEWQAICKYFINPKVSEKAIMVIDSNSAHNKRQVGTYIKDFITEISQREKRNEFDVLLELFSLLPKEEKIK